MSEVAQVAICMGSDSDWPVMQAAALALEEFDVPHEVLVLSAHRMPLEMVEFGSTAVERGLKVIIAGAGGAAHLPGMLAALTPLPVIGVPVAVGNARNAGLLAVRILSVADPDLVDSMGVFQAELNAQAKAKGQNLPR